ncbi:TRAP transporter large permease subunit [Methylobacterium phyllosphaerae]
MSAGESTLTHGAIERTSTTLALSPYAALRLYGRGLDLVEWLCRALLVVALVGELGIILWDITARSTIDLSLLWADEAAKLCLTTLAFIGGALAYRAKHHTTVEFVRQLLPAHWREPVAIAIDGLVLVTAATVGYVSLDLLSIAALSTTPILQISAAWFVVPLSVGMGLVVLFAIERFAMDYRPALAWRTLAAVAVAVVLAVIALPAVSRAGPQAALSLMLILFFATVLLGLPVSFAMLLGSLFYLQLTGTAPLIAAAQNTVDGTSNFILLTLPFFIWTGLIMERGGISLRLVRFAMALVGHLRGGLLQVVVLTIYLVSGISGSKVADVVAVGSVLRGELKKQGYGPERSAAVLAASAAMSETIPPSLAMLVLGSVAPISIGTLFIAGLLPAAVIAVLLMILNWVLAVREGAPRMPRATGPDLALAAGAAALPLVMPVLMVVGIRFGFATPTEVSAVAVLYGLILACGVYRAFGLRDLVRIVVECGVLSGMVLFIIAAAGSFAWTLTAANLPVALISLLHALGDSRAAFLIGSIALLVVVGSLLEGLPALIILGPLLIPIAGQYGIDSIHYAMVIILAMGIGIFIPPIGIGFYIACAVAESRIEATSRAMIPYLIVLVLGVLAVAFIPWFTHALPNLVGSR